MINRPTYYNWLYLWGGFFYHGNSLGRSRHSFWHFANQEWEYMLPRQGMQNLRMPEFWEDE